MPSAHVSRKAFTTSGSRLASSTFPSDRLRMNLLLNVDRHDRHLERVPILFVLAFPDQLRIERRIARVQHRLRRLLGVGDKVAQLLRGNVHPLVAVLECGDGDRCVFLVVAWRHGRVRRQVLSTKATSTFPPAARWGHYQRQLGGASNRGGCQICAPRSMHRNAHKWLYPGAGSSERLMAMRCGRD
jgi:hypothetical protein